jgi:hypothetical protein
MPFLNATAFIQGPLERGFAQTYDRWALLRVDGGSADARTAMARRVTGSRGGVLCGARGPSASGCECVAPPLGVSHATGQYVARPDADAVWLSQNRTSRSPFSRYTPSPP